MDPIAPEFANHTYRALEDVVRSVDHGELERALFLRFASRITRNDIRLRFGAQIDLLDGATVRRFLIPEHKDGEFSWMLDDLGAVAALSQCVLISPDEAEIALLVRSDLKRRGLGTTLMQDLISRADGRGLCILSAQVLSENAPALQLAIKMGFTITRRSGQDLRIELPLGGKKSAPVGVPRPRPIENASSGCDYLSLFSTIHFRSR